jgi:hypothetical protein
MTNGYIDEPTQIKQRKHGAKMFAWEDAVLADRPLMNSYPTALPLVVFLRGKMPRTGPTRWMDDHWLGDQLNCSPKTVQRTRRALADRGHLRFETGQDGTRYLAVVGGEPVMETAAPDSDDDAQISPSEGVDTHVHPGHPCPDLPIFAGHPCPGGVDTHVQTPGHPCPPRSPYIDSYSAGLRPSAAPCEICGSETAAQIPREDADCCTSPSGSAGVESASPAPRPTSAEVVELHPRLGGPALGFRSLAILQRWGMPADDARYVLAKLTRGAGDQAHMLDDLFERAVQMRWPNERKLEWIVAQVVKMRRDPDYRPPAIMTATDAILATLEAGEPLTAREICSASGITFSAVSTSLSKLKAAGVVESIDHHRFVLAGPSTG